MKNKIVILGFVVAVIFSFGCRPVLGETAQNVDVNKLKAADTDKDGLSDYDELYVYRTKPNNPDSDNDGYLDGTDEVVHGYDPNSPVGSKLQKTIKIVLADQSLTYFLGPYSISSFKVSSGLKNTTPKGEFSVLKKLPKATYKGPGYYYPNTKWNLLFKIQKKGNLYIHGAPWNRNMGRPGSHGCVNVTYADMEGLYNWADVGTKVVIE